MNALYESIRALCHSLGKPALQETLESAFRVKDCNQEGLFVDPFQGSSGE